mgnify:CR=1 FL=1
MTKNYCDVCGKEIIEASNVCIGLEDVNHSLRDVKMISCCDWCSRKFKKFFAIEKRKAKHHAK